MVYPGARAHSWCQLLPEEAAVLGRARSRAYEESALEAFLGTQSFLLGLPGDSDIMVREVAGTFHAPGCKAARRVATKSVSLSDLAPAVLHSRCTLALAPSGADLHYWGVVEEGTKKLERLLSVPARTLDEAAAVWSTWRNFTPHAPGVLPSWWLGLGLRVEAHLQAVEDRLSANPAAVASIVIARAARAHEVNESYGQQSWVHAHPDDQWRSSALVAAASPGGLLRHLRQDGTAVLIRLIPREPGEYPSRIQSIQEAALTHCYEIRPGYWYGPSALLACVPSGKWGAVVALGAGETAATADTAAGLEADYDSLEEALEVARAI